MFARKSPDEPPPVSELSVLSATSARGAEPRPPPRLLFWPALLFACGLGVSYLGARLHYETQEERRRESVRAELEPIRGTLSRELFAALHLTEGITSLVAIEGGLSEPRFRALAKELLGKNELLRNVAVAPDGVVRLVHPLEGNEVVLGLDYARNPGQWPSVQRMRSERRMVVAGPVQLLQGTLGVVGRSPIYLRDQDVPGAEPRYWGLTSTVIELDRLLARTPLASASERLDIALRGLDGDPERGPAFWGDDAVFGANPVMLEVPLPSGSWRLAGVPRDGWPELRAIASPYLLAGSALSLLLSGLLLRVFQASFARDREAERRREVLHALERARAELEERVRARTRELSVALDAAESADRLKSAFLATMSHELRTPLNSIIGFTGILLGGLAGPLTAEQRKQLGMVRSSAEHLLALINDVLDLSKIEAGQLQLGLERFDVAASIEKAVATIRPECDAKGLALQVSIEPGIAPIESDKRRVEQVLLNLLANAAKFTPSGGVSVKATCEDDLLRVTVSDTGIGIAPEDQIRVFLPFSQVDSGIERRHDGTGLGLSICKRLIELLGGRIWVESEPGRGSTFGFELPVRRARGAIRASIVPRAVSP